MDPYMGHVMKLYYTICAKLNNWQTVLWCWIIVLPDWILETKC